MKTRVLRNVSLAVGLAVLLLAGLVWSVRVAAQRSAADNPPAKVSPRVWDGTAGGREAEFLVLLASQADLSAASAIRGREARLRYVYDTLRWTALYSQRSLRSELEAAGVSYRPYYIVNMVAVTGDRALVTRLAARSDVAAIVANPPVRQALPEAAASAAGAAPAIVGWGVLNIHADQVWTLGYTGTGIVVAGADTGCTWEHPALMRQYRGFNGVTTTHDYNWHDAVHSDAGTCGPDSPEPCDGYVSSHGTHTMGIMVGDDGAGHQIGVAPGARWIGCRNMDSRGDGTPARYAECFEFFLAPYPIGGDPFTDGVPSLAPHVINNSWGCTPSEGCSGIEITRTLQPVIEAVHAAGIVVVGSAGNDGSACSTVREPPAIYDAVFTVGATNISDTIAGFSSRGPVIVDGSGRPKPDISAPGVAVLSSIKGDGYATMSGTSMSGPHVAGTVALLWSAVPYLVGDVDTTEQVIMQTARPRISMVCGGASGGQPNNVYGWGIVDALACVQGALQPGLTVTKTLLVPPVVGPRLTYVIRVANTAFSPAQDIVLTDTLPAGTGLAWASAGSVRVGDVVSWSLPALDPGAGLVATMAVTIEHLPRGTQVVNVDYGAQCSGLLTPAMGTALVYTIPWQFIFPVVMEGGP